MCISDRLVVSLVNIERESVAQRDARPGRNPMARALVSPEPVSYTHLRAHETVLDIVCRLLLEKKKQEVAHYDMRAYTDKTAISLHY